MRSAPNTSDSAEPALIRPRTALIALSAGALWWAARGCSPPHSDLKPSPSPVAAAPASPAPLTTMAPPPLPAFSPLSSPKTETNEDTGVLPDEPIDPCLETNEIPDWVVFEVQAHVFNLFDLVIEDLSTEDCTIVDDSTDYELELDGTHCAPGWYFEYEDSINGDGGQGFTLISTMPADIGYLSLTLDESLGSWCICDPSRTPFSYKVHIGHVSGPGLEESGSLCLSTMDEALHHVGMFTEHQPAQISAIRAFP